MLFEEKQQSAYTKKYWFYARNLGHPFENPLFCQIRVIT